MENKDDGGTPNEIIKKKFIKGKVVDGWWCWKNTFLYFFSSILANGEYKKKVV